MITIRRNPYISLLLFVGVILTFYLFMRGSMQSSAEDKFLGSEEQIVGGIKHNVVKEDEKVIAPVVPKVNNEKEKHHDVKGPINQEVKIQVPEAKEEEDKVNALEVKKEETKIKAPEVVEGEIKAKSPEINKEGKVAPPVIPKVEPKKPVIVSNNTLSDEKVNACFVVLIRNSELEGFKKTMFQLENRFNKKYNYPYVFLNDQPFTDDFKKQISELTSSGVEFGIIPKEHWSIPSHIDPQRHKDAVARMKNENILYGTMESYHHMCRFESGFFFKHELTLKYDYYWRVEPDVKFPCEIEFDPFLFMKNNNKMYGFTISLYEYKNTIPTLWDTVKAWIKEKNIKMPEDNAMKFISNDEGESYNLCHFWSNFEIAPFSMWRNPQYMEFFDYLDKTGGFFYERWGDAPIHSIYAALTLKMDQIHFFNEIGYTHPPYTHCPKQNKFRSKCDCNAEDSFDADSYSCSTRWFSLNHLKFDD